MLRLLRRLAAPPRQTFTTVQPTQSTVCYTVSTRAEPRTLYASILARFVVGACALLTLLAKWEFASDTGSSVLHVLHVDSLAWAAPLLQRLAWRYAIAAVAATLWLVLRRGYTEESFLVLQGLGVQTSTSSSTYLQGPTTRFIPTTSIQDIFIHEAFKGFEAVFYLAVVVKDEEDVVVVFPTLLPRRLVLEDVWRGARACIFGTCQRPKGTEQLG